MREIASVAECLLCRSYFVVVLDVIDLSQFSGKQGKQVLSDKYAEIHQFYSDTTRIYQEQHCPTCSELCHGVHFKEFVRRVELDPILTISKFILWNEGAGSDDEEEDPAENGVALYINVADEGKKPKWTLQYGVGPPNLELDTSQSGRIYKRSLAPLKLQHISTTQYEKDEYLSPELYTERVETIMNNLKESFQKPSWINVCKTLESFKPIYENYEDCLTKLGW